MESMIESLRSSDVEAMIGTCNFLETVVVHDFSAFAFLQHKELFTVARNGISCFEKAFKAYIA